MQVYGKNVLLMTEPHEIQKVYLSRNDKEIMEYIKKNKIHYIFTDNKIMDKMCSKKHQGVIIEKNDFVYHELEDILQKDFLLILDHLEDPHNFGAIIRTAEAAGIGGIIIPKDRSVNVTETVVKTSVGTADKVPIVKVTNLVNTIKKLQERNFFVYGADMDGKDIRKMTFEGKKVLVIGNEGKGISTLLEKKCDEIIKIPMQGKVNSLNASVAAAILIFKMGGLS